MNRRGFLKALAAIPVAAVLAPLATRTTFITDRFCPPGTLYFMNPPLRWPTEPLEFYDLPDWLDVDGTILSTNDPNGYVGTWTWDKS